MSHERAVQVPLPGGRVLYGRQREVPGLPGAPVVIIVHGLTGHMDEQLHFNAARCFQTWGYAVVRINLYGEQPDARDLVDCTVSVHAADLDAVIRDVRRRRPGGQLGVVGHSLGGLTALLAAEPVECKVLWDPSHSGAFRFLKSLDHVEALGQYRLRWGTDHLLGAAMVEELMAIDTDEVARRETTPLLVAAADDERTWRLRSYASAAAGPVRFTVIPGADHCFTIDDTAKTLYDETRKWLDQWMGPGRASDG